MAHGSAVWVIFGQIGLFDKFARSALSIKWELSEARYAWLLPRIGFDYWGLTRPGLRHIAAPQRLGASIVLSAVLCSLFRGISILWNFWISLRMTGLDPVMRRWGALYKAP